MSDDDLEWPEEMLLSKNHRHEILNYTCDDNDIDNAVPYIRRDVVAALTAERDALEEAAHNVGEKTMIQAIIFGLSGILAGVVVVTAINILVELLK
jgi:hypothetical protein